MLNVNSLEMRASGIAQYAIRTEMFGRISKWYVPLLWEHVKGMETKYVDTKFLLNKQVAKDRLVVEANVMGVDLSYPIILDEDYQIFDGYHRFCKSQILGKDHVEVIQIDTKVYGPDHTIMFGSINTFKKGFVKQYYKHLALYGIKKAKSKFDFMIEMYNDHKVITKELNSNPILKAELKKNVFDLVRTIIKGSK